VVAYSLFLYVVFFLQTKWLFTVFMLRVQNRVVRDSLQRRSLYARNAGNCRVSCHSIWGCEFETAFSYLHLLSTTIDISRLLNYWKWKKTSLVSHIVQAPTAFASTCQI